MVQNNAINQYSQRLAVGITATSSDVNDITPFTVRYDQNGQTAVVVSNMTAGNASSCGMAMQSNSGQGWLYMFDDGHATGWTAGRFVINGDSGSLGVTLALASASSQTIKMSDSTTGLTIWEMSTASERTMISQPCFSAYNSVDDANVTGDGTVVTVDFDTEIFDQNSDFAADTFTAPVAGRYLLSYTILIEGLLTSHTLVQPSLVTSNRTYYLNDSTYIAMTASNTLSAGTSVIVDMDASDTATVQLGVYNGTKVVDVGGASVPITIFTGMLLC